METCWVLKRLHGATEAGLRDTERDLLDARQLIVDQRDVVAGALARLAEGPGGIADAPMVQCAIESGCRRVSSFDEAAVRLGMTLLR